MGFVAHKNVDTKPPSISPPLSDPQGTQQTQKSNTSMPTGHPTAGTAVTQGQMALTQRFTTSQKEISKKPRKAQYKYRLPREIPLAHIYINPYI